MRQEVFIVLGIAVLNFGQAIVQSQVRVYDYVVFLAGSKEEKKIADAWPA
jgi:hypothetical protein